MLDDRSAMLATVDLLVKPGVRCRAGEDAAVSTAMMIETLALDEPSRDWVLEIGKYALSLAPGEDLSKYLTALHWSFQDEPPPFGTVTYTDMYRRASSNPQWMAVSLIKQAERAGRVAIHLWGLAAAANEPVERQVLKHHAVRKSDDVRSRLDVVDLTFPGVVDPALRASLDELSPGYVMERPFSSDSEPSGGQPPSTPDLLAANHLAIRAVALQVMERAAVPAHSPAENLAEVTALLDRFVIDGLTLVCDTARLVENRVKDMDAREVAELSSRCLGRTIRDTSEEPIDFTYHSRFGNYP